MIRTSVTFVTVCLMLISVMALSPGVSAKPSGNGPGNSANAKLCQKDGWMTLARSGSSGVPFANQDECVSYGAQGGEIVPLVLRSLRLEWVPNECADGILHWEGFEPGTYEATWILDVDGESSPFIVPETLNFNTTSGSMRANFGGSDLLFVTSVGIEVDGVNLSPIPVLCDL